MKKNIRFKMVLIATIISVFALSACQKASTGNTGAADVNKGDVNSGGESTADVNADKGEAVKLTFLRAGTDELKRQAFNELLDEFMKENPDITVEYQEAPWGDDIETRLNTGFASGTAPDVINYSLASIGSRVPLGQYESLNAYVEGYEGLDDYYESILEAGSVGNDLYGLGYVADARMLVYNTEMFEKAGLDPNAPPTTWEELLDYHKKLTIKDENGNVIQTGFGLATNGANLNQWLQIFAAQNGVQNLVDEATNEILFNTPEAIEAMEFLKQIYDIGLIPWTNGQNDQNPLMNGTAAMSILNADTYAAANVGDLEGKLKMAPAFSHKNQATFGGVHFMFMSSESAHKEEAWRLIEFLTSKDSMQKYCEIVGIAPLRSSLEGWYKENGDENAEIVLQAISIGKGSAKVAYSQTMFNIVDEAMERIFYGDATVEDALNEAAQELQQEIDNQ